MYIYRASGTSLDMFIDLFELLIRTVKNTSKTIFLCDDFYIYILKYNNNKGTQHFVEVLWGAMAYRLEGRTLNRENPVSNPTAVASNLWQV